MTPFAPTDRTTLKRLPQRAVYDKVQVYSILDEAFLCHVGFAVDGQPYVIPTSFVRVDDRVYIHGSAASRMLGTLESGVDVCLTVTLIDGFVLARSAFKHSLNYRSVVVLGRAAPVTDPHEKMEALHRFTDHVVPGRWDEVRHPSEQELKATSVLVLPLAEVSAKIRSGGPNDVETDYTLPVWAGVVPMRTAIGEPLPDPRMLPGVPPIDRRRFRR